MYHIQLILAIALTILFLSFSLSAATCNPSDKKALIAFKKHFPNNTFPDDWDMQDNCCFWGGVDCDASGRVNSLYFTTDSSDTDYFPINLTGTIPPSVGDLTALQSFGLFGFTELVGPLPPQMANLKNIQDFVISNCGISGPIPSFVSEWTSLSHFNIDYCKVTGSIPPSLGNLVNLSVIGLANNKLTGPIPASLFSRLNNGTQALLEVNNNKLTGPIPQSFASVNWIVIDVSYNQLCGPIPTGGYFSSIDVVRVAHNKCLCGAPLAACK